MTKNKNYTKVTVEQEMMAVSKLIPRFEKAHFPFIGK